MSEERRVFDAEIVAGRRGGAMVEIPFSVQDAFGTRGQVKVKATFDGVDYRGSIAPMGGGMHILGIRKEIRERIGKGIGDTVIVTLERDSEPREVEVPPELAEALAADAVAETRYQSLSFTHRREFAEWVGGAKKQDTRERRAAMAIEMLRAGRTR